MNLSTSTDSAVIFLYPKTTTGETSESLDQREMTFTVGVHLEVPSDSTSRTVTSLTVTLTSLESMSVSIVSSDWESQKRCSDPFLNATSSSNSFREAASRPITFLTSQRKYQRRTDCKPNLAPAISENEHKKWRRRITLAEPVPTTSLLLQLFSLHQTISCRDSLPTMLVRTGQDEPQSQTHLLRFHGKDFDQFSTTFHHMLPL